MIQDKDARQGCKARIQGRDKKQGYKTRAQKEDTKQGHKARIKGKGLDKMQTPARKSLTGLVKHDIIMISKR